MRRRGGGTGESTQEEGTDCNVRREVKSSRKQINENGIFQIGFGRWSREGDRKHFHGFRFELVFYNSRLVVGGNNNSFVEWEKKEILFGVHRQKLFTMQRLWEVP